MVFIVTVALLGPPGIAAGMVLVLGLGDRAKYDVGTAHAEFRATIPIAICRAALWYLDNNAVQELASGGAAR